MSKTYTTLIVGAHFRPPAKQVLQFLPAGTQLSLEREDDNPYDSDAVRVYVEPGEVPESQVAGLNAELENVGMTIEMLMSTGPVFLGYVPSQDGKPLAKARAAEPELLGNRQIRDLFTTPDGVDLMGSHNAPEVRLAFGLDGSPRLQITTDDCRDEAP